jgi:Tol biopolymer transport system component
MLIQRDFRNGSWSAGGVTRSGVFYYVAYTSTSDIYTASMDPSSGKVTSAPIPVPTPRTGLNVAPRWSPDSRQLLYFWGVEDPTRNRELSIYSFDTRKEQPVARRVLFQGGGACWSGDGASILFSRAFNTDLTPPYEPVKVDLSSGEPTALFQKGASFHVRTCSDKSIAYTNGPVAAPDSVQVRSIADGAETTVYKFSRRAGIVLPSVSHDSRNVAFFANADGPWPALLAVPADGGVARELVRAKYPAEFQRLWGLAWSPDDRFLYFLKREDAKAPYEMFRVPAAGGQMQSTGLKAADLRDIDIAPDGTRVAFSIGNMNKAELWALENFLPTAK